MSTSKRRRDVNQLAKFIVDQFTDIASAETGPAKNPAAVALGKLGAAKGGQAREAALSAAKRKAIAKKAAMKRRGHNGTVGG